jgi:5-methyltetrahydrofolate--homocysteine methyltransferase
MAPDPAPAGHAPAGHAPDPLTRLLAERDWLLADGATGTTLNAMGLGAVDAPELLNASAPASVRALHEGAIAAGSDVFLTNSFGGNAARLRLHEAGGRVRTLNRAAARLAREAADRAGRTVVVAGSIGPTGAIVASEGDLAPALAAEMFAEQAAALVEGGADILWIETISAPDELHAAATAVVATGRPWCCTMSFEAGGRTMGGLTPKGFVDLVAGLPVRPLAVGANCGVGAADLLRVILALAAAAPGLPIIAKANAGIPKRVAGTIVYDGTPALMADYARLARDAGARIIGGCCGTTHTHIAAMRAALADTARGPAPTPATITARLGPFTEIPPGIPA